MGSHAHRGVDVAIGVVAHQIAVIDPHHASGAKPTAQLGVYLLAGEGLVAVRSQQTLAGGKLGAPAVALDAAALEHHVVMVFAAAVEQPLLAEVAGDGIVVLPAELLAPAVEAEVEQHGLVAAHEGDGAMVARPGVVGVAAGKDHAVHAGTAETGLKQLAHMFNLG